MAPKRKVTFNSLQDKVISYSNLTKTKPSFWVPFIRKDTGERLFSREEIKAINSGGKRNAERTLKAHRNGQETSYPTRYQLPQGYDLNQFIVHETDKRVSVPLLTQEQYDYQRGPTQPQDQAQVQAQVYPPAVTMGKGSNKKSNDEPTGIIKNKAKSVSDDLSYNEYIDGVMYDRVLRLNSNKQGKGYSADPYHIVSSITQRAYTKGKVIAAWITLHDLL